jgi:hypothetical protein
MRPAEHENEGDNEELIAEVVVDVQDPAAPIIEATRLGDGSNDTGCVITRLSEVVYHGAAAIDQNLPHVGAVKIHVGHVQPPAHRVPLLQHLRFGIPKLPSLRFFGVRTEQGSRKPQAWW